MDVDLCPKCSTPLVNGRCLNCFPLLHVTPDSKAIQIDPKSGQNNRYHAQYSNREPEAINKSLVYFPIQKPGMDSELEALDLLLILGLRQQNFDQQKTVIANVCQALKQRQFNLGSIYRVFCRNAAVKQIVLERFQTEMDELKQEYSAAKAQIRQELLDTTRESGQSKPWEVKVARLLGADRDKLHYIAPSNSPLANDQVCWLTMSGQASWFRALIALSTIRKTLTERNLRTGRAIQHLTILNFDGFALFVVNSKHGRQGTTRMVWPMTRTAATAEEKDVIRVLDMTYKDIYDVIYQILLQQLKFTDQDLAQAMLGVVRNDSQAIQSLKSKPHVLGSLFCSFLYGIGLQGTDLTFTRTDWRLSRKARAPKDLNKLGVQVTAYETVCYILTILFLAEPRHALGMWRSTLLALDLVATGHLTFRDLFGTLNQAIAYGRLLPGANVLGKVLTQGSSSLQIHSGAPTSAHGIALQAHVTTSLAFQQPVAPLQLSVHEQPKRLAMPLVDSVLHTQPDQVIWNYTAAIQGDGSLPIFQPLMKALFIELLVLIRQHEQTAYQGEYQSYAELIKAAEALLKPPQPQQPVLPGPARRGGSDQLWTPHGYVAWDVASDANALFRVVALALDLDEDMHGAYRLRAADVLIDDLLSQGKLTAQQAVFARISLCNLSMYPLDPGEILQSIRQLSSQAEQLVFLIGAKHLPILDDLRIQALYFLAQACNINLMVFYKGNDSPLNINHMKAQRTVAIAFDGQHYYLLLKEGEKLSKQVDVAEGKMEISEGEEKDPAYVPVIDGEDDYDDFMPTATGNN